MNPIRRGELKYKILSAYVEYSDTSEREYLSSKGESICHFFEPFYTKDDKIVLRIDWSDISKNGYPTLDADFYNLQTGKKRQFTGKRLESHHTKPSSDEERVYEWVFNDYSRSFKLIVNWLARVAEKIEATDSISIEVHRNGVKVEK